MKYIEFSLDYEGLCESVDIQEGFPFEVTEEDVDQFVTELIEKDLSTLSDHRTQFKVEWSDVGTMDISVVSYKSPSWDDFEEYFLKNVTSVEIKNSI